MTILKALKKVFKEKAYWILTSSIAFFVFVFSVYLPNLGLIKTIVFSGTASAASKLNFMASLLGGIKTNNTYFSAVSIILVSVLLSINVSMLVYMFKKNKKAISAKENVNTVGGVLGGLFGIGCAACGSIILVPLLASLGAGGVIAALPFHGVEFSAIGLVLIFVSIWILARKINDPLVCPVE